jgi:hypothetical protein
MITKEFETSQGTVTLRGLKRGEIKRLRAAGINVGGNIPLEKLEDHTAALLAAILPESFMEKFDELEESEILKMHREVLAMTYPKEEQTKNSA